MHVIIENQLASGEPTQVRAALGRLRAAGLGRHEAIHAIASVLVRHLHGLLRGTPAEHLYEAEVDALTAEGWNGDRR